MLMRESSSQTYRTETAVDTGIKQLYLKTGGRQASRNAPDGYPGDQASQNMALVYGRG